MGNTRSFVEPFLTAAMTGLRAIGFGAYVKELTIEMIDNKHGCS
jgi:hypothetical protein